MTHHSLPSLAQRYPQATHAVRVNGETLPVRADTASFQILSGMEDCPGCGQQAFGIINKPEHALLCDVCGMMFPLIPLHRAPSLSH